MAKRPYHVDDFLNDLAKVKDAEARARPQKYENDLIYTLLIFQLRFREVLKLLCPSLSFDENEELNTIQDHANSIDKCFLHLLKYLKDRSP